MNKAHIGILRICVLAREVLDLVSETQNVEHLYNDLKTVEDYTAAAPVLGQTIDLPDTKMSVDFDFNSILKEFGDELKISELFGSVLARIEETHIDRDKYSDSLRNKVRTMVNKLKGRYLAFQKEFEIIKLQFIESVGEKIAQIIIQSATSEEKKKRLTNLRSEYHKNNHLVNIYAEVLQKVSEVLFNTDKELYDMLVVWIEEDKRRALSGHYKTDSKHNKANNPPQSRFGLLPVTSSMPLKELLPMIFTEERSISNIAKTTDFAKISKEHKIGIIVLNSVVYTPVEYNVRSLINENEAKVFIQPNEFGINKKIIDRFTTLRTFGNVDKWDFSMEVYGEDYERFYIVETLDGKTYRALAPWITLNKFVIPKHRVKKILDYRTNYKLPSKSLEYHSRCMETAVKNMFLGKALALDTFEKQLDIIESGKIQSSIIDAVIEAADKLIKKDYKDVISTPLEVNDILHHPVIVKTFTNAIVEEFVKSKEKLSGGTFPMYEVLASFTTALQMTGRRFAREIHNGYSRDPLKPEDIGAAVEKIHTVIKNATELVVKSDENLFTSNYYKYLILNYAV